MKEQGCTAHLDYNDEQKTAEQIMNEYFEESEDHKMDFLSTL